MRSLTSAAARRGFGLLRRPVMIGEAKDLLEESATLRDILAATDEVWFDAPTQFKAWTINDVLRHLHVWNVAAACSARDEPAFTALIARRTKAESLRAFEKGVVGDLRGAALLALWWHGVEDVATLFRGLDPKRRLNWVGPSMSARSSVVARQMETWAHGQEVWDLLGVERVAHDRLRNIAHLGVATFAWSYNVRGRQVPERAPHLKLWAPSGVLWTWNEPSDRECISGDAEAFCQVVTQTRHVLDTSLRAVGPIAHEWMSIAQCFAGAAHAPPAPGTRFRGDRTVV